MNARFLDSNVALYLFSADAGKAERSAEVLSDGGTVSVQVLNEVASVAHRKMKLAWDDINSMVEELVALVAVVPVTIETHRSARAIASRYGLSFYDAAIVAAALEADCTELFSEDLQHGQKFGALRVINPYV
jgi:predicted nucleic acid-binding protein